MAFCLQTFQESFCCNDEFEGGLVKFACKTRALRGCEFKGYDSNPVPRGESSWEPGREDWERLLAKLDPDPQKAALKYAWLYAKLFRLLEWRGVRNVEDAADETLKRVVRKISEGVVIPNVYRFIQGVMEWVALEYRKQERREVSFDEGVVHPLADETTDRERQLDCLDRCLAKRPFEEEHMIRQYYATDDRLVLAESLGLTVTALRVRTCRIRDSLKKCVHGCIQGS